MYGYVGNDPVNFTDPSGYKKLLILQTIRKWIRGSVSGEDVFAEIIETGIGIPVNPVTVFLAIMSPVDAHCPEPYVSSLPDDGLTASERLDLVFYLKTGFPPPAEIVQKMQKHAIEKVLNNED